ncbi:hypothetical protein KJ765_05575 [Candidatus Micrarchaeota archaeon]|nr:hypothetical protein [Candidatus Micrarchaeota archaeon]
MVSGGKWFRKIAEETRERGKSALVRLKPKRAYLEAARLINEAYQRTDRTSRVQALVMGLREAIQILRQARGEVPRSPGAQIAHIIHESYGEKIPYLALVRRVREHDGFESTSHSIQALQKALEKERDLPAHMLAHGIPAEGIKGRLWQFGLVLRAAKSEPSGTRVSRHNFRSVQAWRDQRGSSTEEMERRDKRRLIKRKRRQKEKRRQLGVPTYREQMNTKARAMRDPLSRLLALGAALPPEGTHAPEEYPGGFRPLLRPEPNDVKELLFDVHSRHLNHIHTKNELEQSRKRAADDLEIVLREALSSDRGIRLQDLEKRLADIRAEFPREGRPSLRMQQIRAVLNAFEDALLRIQKKEAH